MHKTRSLSLIKQDVIIIFIFFMHILLKLSCGKSGEHRARWLICSTPPKHYLYINELVNEAI